LEDLLADKEQDKQRAAAELLAGVLNGQQVPLVETRFSYCSFRIETLADRYTKKIMGVVLTFDQEDIESEHQDRHAYDMVNFLGSASCCLLYATTTFIVF
jgi:hypothetical protein